MRPSLPVKIATGIRKEIKKQEESAEISQSLDGKKENIDELQQNIENAASSLRK